RFAPQTRILIETPTSVHAVGVHDQRRRMFPGKSEFMNMCELMANDAIAGNEASAAAVRHESPGNIAHTGIAHDLAAKINFRYGHRGPTRLLQTRVGHL